MGPPAITGTTVVVCVTVEGTVTLSVRIEEDYGTKQFTVPVTSGAGGAVEPGEVTVTLRGPFPALNQIKPEEITAVVQPGGSRRDAEVVAAADERGLAMLLTGVRHFRH